MGGWLAGRLLQALVVLGIKSFVIYALIGLMPGDPVDIMIAADPRLAPEDAARLRALYGLDLPIGERYLNWLGAALAGDFGYSRTYNRPVLEILLPRLANTLLLLGIAAMLAIAVAVMAGIVAALRPRGIADAAINFACFAGVSVPPFWLALVLIIVFAVTLGWLPAGGMGEAGAPWSERAVYLVLPVVTLMAASLAAY
ncbi:MAG: ABC transporter permease, partial [Alphaproteobacteria bacterium]|nr:ABC transporter permease [Alphaproteobacteria bacterium]